MSNPHNSSPNSAHTRPSYLDLWRDVQTPEDVGNRHHVPEDGCSPNPERFTIENSPGGALNANISGVGRGFRGKR